MNQENHFQNNLKKLRKDAGLRQIDVAEILGHVSADRISHWEKGLSVPGLANLFKLTAVFDVTAEDLYQELKVIAAQEVEEKRVSLKNEDEWTGRMEEKADSPTAVLPI